MVPANTSLSVYLPKLREAADIGSPAKVVDDEPLNTSCFGGVDECHLEPDARGSDNAYDSVLAGERRGQSSEAVLRPDERHIIAVLVRGVKPRDDSNVEAGIDESGGDGCSKVS